MYDYFTVEKQEWYIDLRPICTTWTENILVEIQKCLTRILLKKSYLNMDSEIIVQKQFKSFVKNIQEIKSKN